MSSLPSPEEGVPNERIEELVLTNKCKFFPYIKPKTPQRIKGNTTRGANRCKTCHKLTTKCDGADCKPCISYSTCPTKFFSAHKEILEAHNALVEDYKAAKSLFQRLQKDMKKEEREKKLTNRKMVEDKKRKHKEETEVIRRKIFDASAHPNLITCSKEE